VKQFQERISGCEAVPGWNFQNGRKFQDGSSGCEAVPGREEFPRWKFKV
jgi:hypothetical protein